MNTVDMTTGINEAHAEGFLTDHIRTALMKKVERLDEVRTEFLSLPFDIQNTLLKDGNETALVREMRNLSLNIGRVLNGVRLTKSGLAEMDISTEPVTEIDWSLIHCTYQCGGCVNGEFCEDVEAAMRGEDVQQRWATTVAECGHDGECATLAGR